MGILSPEFSISRLDDGRILAAFAGTDPVSGRDWYTNFRQNRGEPTQQYISAVLLARKINGLYPGQVVFTGHSLGGGLAAIAALTTNSRAVTFNAADVHSRTLARNGIQHGDRTLITNVHHRGDILTHAQRAGAILPDGIRAVPALGNQVPVGTGLAANPRLSDFGLVKFYKTGVGIQNHFISAIKPYLEQRRMRIK